MERCERRTGFRGLLAGFFAELDEVIGDRDLGADVVELRLNGEEEVCLLGEWSWAILGDFELLGAHVS